MYTKYVEKAFKWIKIEKVPSAFHNKFLNYFKKTKITVFLPLPENKI